MNQLPKYFIQLLSTRPGAPALLTWFFCPIFAIANFLTRWFIGFVCLSFRNTKFEEKVAVRHVLYQSGECRYDLKARNFFNPL